MENYTSTSSKCQILEPMLINNIAQYNWITNNKSFIIITVGLPCRGKSYMSKRINRWLNWKGIKCCIFNLGQYRRQIYDLVDVDDNWFDPTNDEYVNKRENILLHALKDLKSWITNDSGKVAILDGTNSSIARRKLLLTKLTEFIDVDRILWVESICDDDNLIQENILSSKIYNQDYILKSNDFAIADFNRRITQYKKTYVPLNSANDHNLKFIQLFNNNNKVILNKINDQLSQKISYFLMNLHPKNIVIYLTRHGESQAQIKNIIGTDADLTSNGIEYSHKLKKFIDQETKYCEVVDVMCSTLQRSFKTAIDFIEDKKYIVNQWKQLEEINGGHFEGLTYKHIQEQWPKTYYLRQNNKYTCGWPSGESYQQMIIRLENIFLEIERNKNTLVIIGHQAICRGIYAYLMNILPELCVDTEIKSHTVYKFTYSQTQIQVEPIDL